MPRPVVWYTDGASRAPAIDPYRRLWIAVLEGCQADLDLSRGIRAASTLNVPNGEREREWLTSRDHQPGSFWWVCDVLDLDQEAVREALLYPRPSMAKGEAG